LGLAKATRQQGGDFRLAAVNPSTLDVLEMAGFTSILKLFPSVDEAVNSF
jgi:anti-sigma B factor antagonist